MLKPVLEHELFGLRLQVLIDGGTQFFDVIGMSPFEPVVGTLTHVSLAAPDDLSPAWRGVEAIRGQIPVPETIVGPARGQRITLFAFFELSLHQLSIGDVAQGHDVGVLAAPCDGADMHLDDRVRSVGTDAVQLRKTIPRSQREPEGITDERLPVAQ